MVPTHDTESAANDQNVLRLPMVQKNAFATLSRQHQYSHECNFVFR